MKIFIHPIINNYAENLPEIQVKPWDCRFNFKCQMNAVHNALASGEEEIAMVMYKMNNHNFNIHFVNINKKWEYIDNTIWQWAKIAEYRFIKKIDSADFLDIEYLFRDQIKKLNNLLPFYLKIFWEHSI